MKRTTAQKISDSRKNAHSSLLIAMLVLSILTAIGFVFAGLCASYFEVGFFYRYRILITLLLFFLVFSASSLGFIFYFFRRETLYKLCLSALAFLTFALVIFFCLLATGFLTVVNSVESFKKYLLSAGVWMDVLFILLQYLQVIILPIPSFVTLVAGTALFGAVRCFFYSFFAIVLGSLTAFFIGRFLGYKAVAWMVGKDTLDSWLKKVKGKDNLVLTAMLLLPFFPDDVLCFVAGLSSMTNRYFVVMILIARLISVSTTCFSFDFIPFNTPWGIAAWITLGVLAVGLFIAFYKNQDRLQRWLQNKRNK